MSIARQTTNGHYGACHNRWHYSDDRERRVVEKLFSESRGVRVLACCHYHAYRAQQLVYLLLFFFFVEHTLLCTTNFVEAAHDLIYPLGHCEIKPYLIGILYSPTGNYT